MARRLAKTDVVIIGAGWTGLTAAYELAHAGKRCVVLERGSYRHDADDFAAPKEHDELKYAVHHAHMINTRKENGKSLRDDRGRCGDNDWRRCAEVLNDVFVE